MTFKHLQIQAFLNGFDDPGLPGLRKAGIVPFLRAPLRYMAMTPVASKPDLGLPEFQLCKGTRMYRHENGWRDMRGMVPDNAELEPLPATALREGIEELGLVLGNIARLLPLGEFRFTSATNRQEVAMWLLAAEMKGESDFLPLADIAQTTSARAWFTLAEFKKQGRPDHAHILGQIDHGLQTSLRA